MSMEQPVDSQAIEGAKRQIRGLVDEIAKLSKQELEPDVYYGEFLQRVVSALAAVGGAIWTLTPDRRLRLDFQINLRETPIAEPGEDQRRHTRLLSRIIEQNEPLLAAPYSGSAGDEEAGNPTSFLLVLAPIVSENNVEGVVEIFQRPGSEPVAQRGFLRFVTQMAELAGQWLKSRKLRQYGDQQTLWMQADGFSRAVHESLDVRATAYTIANEGRRLIGCDRVSVAVRHGSRYRVEAVSGQDTFDRRSNTVVLLSRLATTVVATGEPLYYTGYTDDLPPQIEDAVQDYVDESHTKAISVLPLKEPVEIPDEEREEADRQQEGEVVGALIVEQIEDTRGRENFTQCVDIVREHGALALSNAVAHNSVFLMPVWRTLGRARWFVEAKRLPKTISISAAVLVFLLAVIIIPKPFYLKGEAELQPVQRRDVFVATPGHVDEVLVEHREMVEAGQPVAKLVNVDLDVELANAFGKRTVAAQQLKNLRARKGNRELRLTTEDLNKIAGDIAQVQQQLESIDKQCRLLQEKKEQLTVRSPISGIVISWDNKRRLRHRKVNPGEVLMTVADPTGEWELEVFMPEKRMGHVERAYRKLQEKNERTGKNEQLDVRYVLATEPNNSRKGKVVDIHESTEMRDEKGQTVRIRVDIDEEAIKEKRPGASASAKVRAGWAPIAYTWFHEAIEFVQSRLLF
jgi:multidrug efflux pump subunit AcrA (membrane-fusion protein)